MKLLLGKIALFVALIASAAAHAAEINVFAAASLTDSLKEIAGTYEKESGDKIVFNFGASSTLARQIEEGAPADIFFSADEPKMDGLEKNGRIVKETRKNRLSNALAIVVTKDSSLEIRSAKDLTGAKIKRIALADAKAVPAGVYSKTYLEELNLWSAIESKVVPTENVRAALAAIESGNVEAGIVYKTDAAISKEVKIAYEVPHAEGPHISYPMAVIKDSKQPDSAKKFLKYLDSEAAGTVFKKFGFLLRE
jgi:molybdate transport system substrate-binding protein